MKKKETEENKFTFRVDDVRGVVLAWLQESGSNPSDYLTKEGQAYLNGFLQSQNSISLVKMEQFEDLTKSYEDLILRYEKLVTESEQTKKDLIAFKLKSIQRKKKPGVITRFFNNIYK